MMIFFNFIKYLPLALLLSTQSIYADIPHITGEIIDQSTNRKIQALRFTLQSLENPQSKVTIRYDSGRFENEPLKNFGVGEKVRVIMPRGYWKIVEPVGGDFFLPRKGEFSDISIKVVRETTSANKNNTTIPTVNKDVNALHTPLYAVQVFSGTSKNRSSLAKYSLKVKGYESACIFERNVAKGAIFYKVYAGMYERRERAIEVKKIIERNEDLKIYGKPFVLKIQLPCIL